MTLSCPFGRYQYIQLPFGAAQAGNIVQKKLDKLLNDIPNVFDFVDDILTARFDAVGIDHGERSEQVLHGWRQTNLKRNQREMFITG